MPLQDSVLHACAARSEIGRLAKLVPRKAETLDTSGTHWRGRRPRGARLGVDRRAPRHRQSSSSSTLSGCQRRGGGRKDTSTTAVRLRTIRRPRAQRARRPTRAVFRASPAASERAIPVGDDAALCFAHHSQPHRRRKPKHEGWAATSTRLGSGAAIRRAAHNQDHARGAGQPPQPGQPEQSARPEGEGRDQVR